MLKHRNSGSVTCNGCGCLIDAKHPYAVVRLIPPEGGSQEKPVMRLCQWCHGLAVMAVVVPKDAGAIIEFEDPLAAACFPQLFRSLTPICDYVYAKVEWIDRTKLLVTMLQREDQKRIRVTFNVRTGMLSPKVRKGIEK